MATTVHFRGKEFVANDLSIELWMLAVADEIDPKNCISWLKELRDEWQLQALSGFGFGPCPALDHFLTTDERRQQLREHFRRAIQSLARRAELFTAEELNQSGVGGKHSHYLGDFSTQSVIEVGNQFLALVD